jgi:hypothetical protein
MNYTHKDIEELAYFIHLEKKQKQLLNADNAISNWQEAENVLRITDLIHRGSVC